MPGNGDPAFEILVASPSGLGPSQLQIDFSSAYDRVPHADVDLEGTIEEVWTKRLQANSSLFNASKFRYGGYKLISSKQSEIDNVCLCLGLTDYKTFVGTNLSPNWQAFLKCPKDAIERCQHMASPLGNGAVVETKDDCILVLKRSEHVGEFPGHLVFPGGHSEPQEIGVLGHQDLSHSVDLNTKITEEMYTGILREIVEETGVPASTLSDPQFIGVSRRVLNARPTAFFFVKCALATPDVLQFYKDAHDRFESTQLLSIAKVVVAVDETWHGPVIVRDWSLLQISSVLLCSRAYRTHWFLKASTFQPGMTLPLLPPQYAATFSRQESKKPPH